MASPAILSSDTPLISLLVILKGRGSNKWRRRRNAVFLAGLM
jgi:hypothetical protein